MRLSGPAKRLSIFVREDDHCGHRPLYAEIVHRAHKAGLAGASVFRGLEGFGAAAHLHHPHLLRISDESPLLIVIVDTAERIEEFLPQVEELVTDGMIAVDDVQVLGYTGRAEPARTQGRRRRHS
jgi:PII-like signaling protein